jgi:hypothetical protein
MSATTSQAPSFRGISSILFATLIAAMTVFRATGNRFI